MSEIKTMRELFTVLSAGAYVVQTYAPPWPGGKPRDGYFVQDGETKRAVNHRAVVGAMHAHRLKPDDGPCDGVSPRVWRLQPRQKRVRK